MKTIAFIGLGIMGGPMSGHLARGGFDVVGFNRTASKTAALIEAGGRAATSVADAVHDADVIALMLPDTPDVSGVLTGDDGVFANAKAGALIIDFSTIRPDVTTDLAAQAERAGFGYLDAPVSGGEAGAKNAALSIMVGGSAEQFANARPVLEQVGKTIVHVGPAGAGQTVKAANQLIVAANIQVVAEALVLLEAQGVDTEAAFDVLAGGLAGSKVLEQKRRNMLDRSFEPGFRIELHHKDLGIVTAAAREAGVAIPVGAIVAQLLGSAKAIGDGGLDHSALLRGVERLSGRHTPAGEQSAASGQHQKEN
jgi:2-hydroxy-3-oxopropionate reductase